MLNFVTFGKNLHIKTFHFSTQIYLIFNLTLMAYLSIMLSFSDIILSAAFFTASRRDGSLLGSMEPTGVGLYVPFTTPDWNEEISVNLIQ